jgi:hypothetical protein
VAGYRLPRPRFNSRWLAERQGRSHLLSIGDSHARILREVQRRGLLPELRVDICWVSGATAQGLVNPRSQTNAMPIFSRRLAAARPWQVLCSQLGEVDCGFVIWYRAEKHGVSVESQLERSLGGYLELLDQARRHGFRRTLVISAPPPTIPDLQRRGDVARAREAVGASKSERTALTLEYNARLRAACDERRIGFVDVTTPILDPGTGVVDPRYLNPDPEDHHLDPDRFAPLVAERLWTALRSLSPD